MNEQKHNRPRQYRSKLPKPDRNGDVRPRIGGRRFTVGNVRTISQGEMERRMNSLKEFFDAQCDAIGIDFWANWTLPFAKQIEKGQKLVYEVRPAALSDDEYGRANAVEDAEVFSRLRQLGLDIAASDEDAIARGERQLKVWLDAKIDEAVARVAKEEFTKFTGLMGTDLSERLKGDAIPESKQLETRTFHEALRAYRKHIEKTGKKKDNGSLAPSPKNYIEYSKRLEKTHEDFPVWRLDYVKIDELFGYWRNRPESPKTGTNISYEDAKHKMDVLWSVLKWLNRNERWNWKLPENLEINRTPVSLEQDRKKNQTRRVTKNTYTPEQLAIIASHLDTFGKMILGVSVNCGMQPAEIGRLERLDYFTHHPETDQAADWVIFDRPKTLEYGEWVLWPEVAMLVRWGIERANRIGADRLVVNERGVPWYHEDWRNPETQFAKWWQVQKSDKSKNTNRDYHEGIVSRLNRTLDDFPRHTIKTLRKILPNTVRRKYGSEIADLLNARKVDRKGNQGGRDTDRYSDRLYDEAAEAVRFHETTFRPFLDALREDNIFKNEEVSNS